MRYGMSILALVAVLAMGVVVHADSIAIREGGGAWNWDSVAYTTTDTNVDDSYINSAGGGTGNYGTNIVMKTYVLTNQLPLLRVMLYGVKDLTTLLPATSGGDDLVIDSAALVIAIKNSGASVNLPLSIALVTEDWLVSAAGSNESAVTHNTVDRSTC